MLLPRSLQEIICRECGIDGWCEKLLEQIVRNILILPRLACTLCLFGPLQVGLPSPSQITWPQVNRILIGKVSRNSDDLMKLVGQFPSPQGEIIAAIKQECMLIDRFYDNTTEMEAMARVLSIINIIFRQVEPKIRVRLQPSITRHSVFTDVLMFINDDTP